MIFLFFAGHPVIGIIVVIVGYFLEILIDNIFPRVTWQMTVKSLWLVTLILGVVNIILLGIFGGILA